MKVTITVPQEVDLKKVHVSAGVRYWNDCSYSTDNGKTWIEAEDDSDEESNKFMKIIPCVKWRPEVYYPEKYAYYWDFVIDIDTGKIENWPAGFCISTHFKVCDDGEYTILDSNDNIVWNSLSTDDYYVPNFLAIEDHGYGDYIFIDVDGEGNINNWNAVAKHKILKLFES